MLSACLHNNSIQVYRVKSGELILFRSSLFGFDILIVMVDTSNYKKEGYIFTVVKKKKKEGMVGER